MMHIADNQDALLDYLYEEGDPAERMTIARHLQECTKCSVAVLEYQTVRGMLSEWTPPASQLGFRIVQDSGSSPSATVDPRARGGWSWGGGLLTDKRTWAQAAAAVALFAAGMAVSQLDVEYGEGALTVRSRSAAPAGAVRNASIELPSAPQRVPEAVAGRPEGQAVPASAGNSPNAATNNDEVVRQLRAMIEQSEIRQQRELALRLSQVAREVDTQHRADLLRIEQNIGQMEMETGAQINHQQQQVDYLVRTSGVAK